MLMLALGIIAAFNFYVAVAKGRSFRRGFLGMAAISLGVAGICFLVGIVVKNVLGIESVRERRGERPGGLAGENAGGSAPRPPPEEMIGPLDDLHSRERRVLMT